jgi:hypothetical protein
MTETNINRDSEIEEIFAGDPPVTDGDSIVDETDGNFVMPPVAEKGDGGNQKETSEKELTDLEKEIEAGKIAVESDIRARAAALPPTMKECFDLIPELKNMIDVDRRPYLLAEMRKTQTVFREVDCTEKLAVRLSELRNKK